MAYHLQSLVRVIELILFHEKQQEYFDNDTKPQLQSLLEKVSGKSHEEVAVEYLNDLIDRNLIFVREQNIREGVKSLGIHDILRDLCVRKAREKKFFHVVNARTDHNNDASSQEMSSSCLRRVRLFTRNKDIYGSSTIQKQLARSLVGLDEQNKIVPHNFFTLRLLSEYNMENLEAIIQAVTLRYLSLSKQGLELDPWITTFRNLQFLIIFSRFDEIKVPQEVFEMPQLREISSNSMLVCDFMESSSSSKNGIVLQENLHTLPEIEISANIDVVLAKLPNLKDVTLLYTDRSHPTVPPISCLKNIEKLLFGGYKCIYMDYAFDWSFSNTLKSVFLGNMEFPTTFMKRLSMLPNLEVLTLWSILFWDTGVNWKLCEEEKFCRLKYLGLELLKMVIWEADETNFPRLEHLEISGCYKLAQLPSGFGEISTLKKLEVRSSSPAAAKWAREIEKEQLDYYGNDLFEVVVLNF